MMAAIVVLAVALAVALFALRQARARLFHVRHSERYVRYQFKRLLQEAYSDEAVLRARGPMTYEETMFNLDAVQRAADGRWWESDP
jgi:hypothetical protein